MRHTAWSDGGGVGTPLPAAATIEPMRTLRE